MKFVAQFICICAQKSYRESKKLLLSRPSFTICRIAVNIYVPSLIVSNVPTPPSRRGRHLLFPSLEGVSGQVTRIDLTASHLSK